MKRLQVTDLITNRGTFQSLNFSIPADDFVNVFNEFEQEILTFYGTKITYFWEGKDMPVFNRILTEFGFCYTFNNVPQEKLLKANTTSTDFDYFHFTFFHMLNEAANYEKNVPKRSQASNEEFRFKISTNLEQFKKTISSNFNGYKLIFHSPYELPSKLSPIIPININSKYEIFIDPHLSNIDESLTDLNPFE